MVACQAVASPSSLILTFFPVTRQSGFSPSQVVSFIFSLKKIIRDDFKKEISKNNLKDELFVFETKKDQTALLAFDIFMECKEKIFEIRANEVKNLTFNAIERAGLV